MRKALWHILPLILLAYLCAFMDRVNVSFAAVQMNVDLSFSATIYGLGGGLFFLGYSLFEVPSNMMAVRYGSRKWLARIMITWGLLSAGMIFIHTPIEFYVMRFLLGVAEAGFFPGVIYYFASWFPASHRGRAVSRFYVAAPLASLVMGAISGSLLGLNGLASLRGWQWLFLIQGLPSVLVGLIILRFLPEKPANAPWLTTEEKAWIDGTLAHEATMIGEPPTHNVLASLANPKVLLLAATGVLYIGVTTTVVLSAPLLLLALTGYTARRLSRRRRRHAWGSRDAVRWRLRRSTRRPVPQRLLVHSGDGRRAADARNSTIPHRRDGCLSDVCRNQLHDRDVRGVGLGRGSARSRIGGRLCGDQQPVRARRVRDALRLGSHPRRDRGLRCGSYCAGSVCHCIGGADDACSSWRAGEVDRRCGRSRSSNLIKQFAVASPQKAAGESNK